MRDSAAEQAAAEDGIIAHELEARGGVQIIDRGKQVVGAERLMPLVEQTIDQMGLKQARTAHDEDTFATFGNWRQGSRSPTRKAFVYSPTFSFWQFNNSAYADSGTAAGLSVAT